MATSTFPSLDNATLIAMRKYLDTQYRDFSRTYGEGIENLFDPLLNTLIFFERLLLATPWWLIIGCMVALAYFATRSLKLSVMVLLSFAAIGLFGMWEDAMQTMSMISVCTLLTVALGLPIGILMARFNWLKKLITPILDIMQTMPAFVYLIPVVMLLGIGRIPGLLAVVIYAIAPVIRLTDLGIRMVDKKIIEAATAYGANPRQRLFDVQLPLALPTIMAGINQTIMMALSMVVVASMIGVNGLGQPVLKAITNQYFTFGLLNGLAIVALAIVFDRISQGLAQRAQKHTSLPHNEQ